MPLLRRATLVGSLALLASCEAETLRLLPERGQVEGPVTGAGGAPDAATGAGGAAPLDAGAAGGSAPTEPFECVDNGQCGGRRSVCDGPAGKCVGCIDESNCAPSQVCDPLLRQCAWPCDVDRDCPRDRGLHCLVERGLCVECRDDRDCDDPLRHYCDSTTARCSECLLDTDCDAPIGLCDSDLGACVMCIADGDCPKELPLCDPDRRFCEQCRTQQHCRWGTFCEQNTGLCLPLR